MGRRLEDLDAALQHMRSDADAWRADARAGLERLLDVAGAVGRLEAKLDEAVPHIARIEATLTHLAEVRAKGQPTAPGVNDGLTSAAATAAGDDGDSGHPPATATKGGSTGWIEESSITGSMAAGEPSLPRRARGGSRPKKKASDRPGGEALPEAGRETEPPAAPQQPGSAGPPSLGGPSAGVTGGRPSLDRAGSSDGVLGGMQLSVLGGGVMGAHGGLACARLPSDTDRRSVEAPARLAEEERHILTGIERHVQRIAGSMGLYGGVSIGDDNEDRKRLKEKLKAALDRQTRTIVKEQEDWTEYVFGICKPDGRVGKRGSRCCLAVLLCWMCLVGFLAACCKVLSKNLI
jgi:hypothetical protein